MACGGNGGKLPELCEKCGKKGDCCYFDQIQSFFSLFSRNGVNGCFTIRACKQFAKPVKVEELDPQIALACPKGGGCEG